MKRLFWVDGRLSWPFMIVVVYMSLSLIVTDYAWRNLIMPFETLIIYDVAINATVVIFLIGGYRAFFARSRTRPDH